MVKAVFLDFYGTVVYEDGENINIVSKKILETGTAESISEVSNYWWKEFQTLFMDSYIDTFDTQRNLEYQSLVNTIKHFQSTEDARSLSNLLFEYWVKPPIFSESKAFFKECKLPIYIVSNIDRADVMQALEYHNLKPTGVFTSEDAKSYKPRRELFELALKSTKLRADEVVHVGDSLTSDVKGASSLGINTIWLNRTGKETPEGVISVSSLLEIFSTMYF